MAWTAGVAGPAWAWTEWDAACDSPHAPACTPVEPRPSRRPLLTVPLSRLLFPSHRKLFSGLLKPGIKLVVLELSTKGVSPVGSILCPASSTQHSGRELCRGCVWPGLTHCSSPVGFLGPVPTEMSVYRGPETAATCPARRWSRWRSDPGPGLSWRRRGCPRVWPCPLFHDA